MDHWRSARNGKVVSRVSPLDAGEQERSRRSGSEEQSRHFLRRAGRFIRLVSREEGSGDARAAGSTNETNRVADRTRWPSTAGTRAYARMELQRLQSRSINVARAPRRARRSRALALPDV